MPDTLLAILHHILIFALFGLLVAKLTLVRDDIRRSTIMMTVIRIDGFYGLVALLTIIIGVCRVIWGEKGPDFYVHNLFFWLKMAAFILVGLLTVPPTLAFQRWRKAIAADSYFQPQPKEVVTVRRWLKAQLHLFVLIPIFAALMVRLPVYIAF